MKSRFFNLFTLFALLASLVGSMAIVTPVRAASIVVNSNTDTVANDGVCSLREAITNANNDNTSGSTDCAAGAGADIITFAANYTITLVGSQLPAIATVITITGNGEANTIIQAEVAANTASYRVFEVGAAGNLTLNNLTVRHGRCAGLCATNTNSGGGIYNAGILTASNVTFRANSASTSGGGLLNFTNSNATLTNVTFSNNSAGGGGGGGVYNRSVSPTLMNVTFSANSTTNNGGGMFNFTNSSPTLTNVTFSANSAVNGGGMFNTGSNPTLTNVTFGVNSATNGGGIYNNNSSPTLTNAAFSANSAINNGGGIYHLSGTLSMKSSTLSGNSALNGGGGIFSQNGTINITNSTFSGNSTSNEGGGLSKFLGTATIINSTFSGNSSVSNGGNLASYAGTTTLKNTIVANRTGGTSECLSNSGTLTADNTNIDTDGSCDNAVQKTSVELNLGSLQENGGPTKTIELQTGSVAIDAGDITTCNNAPVSGQDQRGMVRPQGAGCDIGAFETGAIIPVVTASNPSAGATLTSLSSINITFNQDMKNDGSAEAANNTANYLLVERGPNGSFDTVSCKGGVVSDDVTQNINTASYSNAGFITTLTFNALISGTYRLFICGTTSIWSTAGLELNNGANDATIDFTVNSATPIGSTTVETTDASSLPTTGFAPNKITSLPVQPTALEYSELGDLWLEIPSLKVKSTIVGVPQNANKTWDVSWLGNDTGWLNGTAFPTWNGNSVLTAHVTNASGVDGPFAAIKELKYGDQVIVHMGGVKYIYEIRSTKLAHPYSTSFAFQSLQDHSYLTLITCSGYNPLNESYLFRRVVRAVLVEVK